MTGCLEKQLTMVGGCAFSLFGRDTWISYPTSSDMGVDSVQRCVSIRWSIIVAVHMRTTHDEVDTRCCSGHVAWMEGPSFHDGEQHVEIVTGWSMIMD